MPFDTSSTVTVARGAATTGADAAARRRKIAGISVDRLCGRRTSAVTKSSVLVVRRFGSWMPPMLS